MRTQSSLGKRITVNRKFHDSRGMIERGQVIRVYPELNTVDVRLLNNGEILQGINGRYGCRILKKQGGYNIDTQESYGEQVSIHEGDIVAVAYLDNKQEFPIILGFLDYTETNQTPIQNEQGRSITIHPDQTYEKQWDTGKFEKTYPNGFEVNTFDNLEPSFNGFNIENLSQKTKRNKFIQGTFSEGFNWLKRLKTRSGDWIQAVLSNGTVKQTLETGNSIIGTTIHDDILTIERTEETKGTNIVFTAKDFTITQNINGTSSIHIANGDTLNLRINGKTDITIDSNGHISITNEGNTTLNTKGNTTLTTQGNLSVKSGGTARITATGSMEVKSSGKLTLDGSSIAIG